MSSTSESLCSHFQRLFSIVGEPGQLLGRVVRAGVDSVRVRVAGAEQSAFVPAGLSADRPVTGDWVAVDPVRNVIASVLPRATEFVRQAAGKAVARQTLAANMDWVFLVMALDSDFSVRRLERYLTLTHASRAQPVIFLTKAASAERVDESLASVRAVAGAAPVHAIDVVAGLNAELPARYLAPGFTAALLGSSGVGKSTLVNHLLGGERARTAGVRQSDDKGRHTTTGSELFQLDSGAALIDTPGLREVQLWASEADVNAAFDELSNVARTCRFRDCKHAGEPGCAVEHAVAVGELAPERVESYQRLLAEVAAHERRSSHGGERARGRQHARLLRDVQRRKYGR